MAVVENFQTGWFLDLGYHDAEYYVDTRDAEVQWTASPPLQPDGVNPTQGLEIG